MSFEQMLRERVGNAPFKSREKDILKVVLGEVQQKSAVKALGDEQCYTIVKGLLKGNTETLGHLPAGDSRIAALTEENEILTSLLPAYWSVEQVKELFSKDGLEKQIQEAKTEGQAMGLAMKHLKSLGAPVEGDTVKLVVADLRKV